MIIPAQPAAAARPRPPIPTRMGSQKPWEPMHYATKIP
jgi:hypothetical protein